MLFCKPNVKIRMWKTWECCRVWKKSLDINFVRQLFALWSICMGGWGHPIIPHAVAHMEMEIARWNPVWTEWKHPREGQPSPLPLLYTSCGLTIRTLPSPYCYTNVSPHYPSFILSITPLKPWKAFWVCLSILMYCHFGYCFSVFYNEMMYLKKNCWFK